MAVVADFVVGVVIDGSDGWTGVGESVFKRRSLVDAIILFQELLQTLEWKNKTLEKNQLIMMRIKVSG